MKGRTTMVAIALLATVAFTITDAQAGRLGGGKSMGKQSSGITQRQAAPSQQGTPPQAAPGPQGAQAPGVAPRQAAAPQAGAAPAAAAAQAGRSRWLAPLAGVAAGLGLAALASHFGFGEELASFMLMALIAMAVLVAVRMFMARRAAQRDPRAAARAPFAYQGVGHEATVTGWTPPAGPVSGGAPVVRPAVAPAVAGPGLRVPDGFDQEGFLREARRQFVRMQAAWDSGDAGQLREFTTADMFRQLQADLDGRGDVLSRTDVVQLEAELLGVDTDAREYTASIRFHGMLREAEGAPAQPFDEVWNLTKPLDGAQGWVLAGVQQLS